MLLPRRFGTPDSKISSKSAKNKTKQEQNGDREEASNPEHTKVM